MAEKCGGGVLGGLPDVFFCQGFGHECARAVTQHKRERLNNTLQREQYAYRALLTLTKRADKVCVNKIVYVGDEH